MKPLGKAKVQLKLNMAFICQPHGRRQQGERSPFLGRMWCGINYHGHNDEIVHLPQLVIAAPPLSRIHLQPRLTVFGSFAITVSSPTAQALPHICMLGNTQITTINCYAPPLSKKILIMTVGRHTELAPTFPLEIKRSR